MADPSNPYSKLTIPKLKMELTNRGIYYTSSLRKPALLQLLINNDREKDEGARPEKGEAEGSSSRSKTQQRSDVPDSENNAGSEVGTGGDEDGAPQDQGRVSRYEGGDYEYPGKVLIRPLQTMPEREEQTSVELMAEATAPYIEMSVAQLAAECKKRGIPTKARWEMDQCVCCLVEHDMEVESEEEKKKKYVREKERSDAEMIAAMGRGEAVQPILDVLRRHEEGAGGKGKGKEIGEKEGGCGDEKGDVVESVE